MSILVLTAAISWPENNKKGKQLVKNIKPPGDSGSISSHCFPYHAGRFRLAIVMPSGYGIDFSWEDRNSLEEVLRLVVMCMDEQGGIDNAIKTVVDNISSQSSRK